MNEATASLQKYASAAEAGSRRAIGKMAAAAEAEIKKQIVGHHDAGTPRPEENPAGTPPMNVSGALRRSIKFEIKKVGFGAYEAIVGPSVVYGRILELGFANGNKYPYVKPAYEKLLASGKLTAIYNAEMSKALSF